MLLRLAWEKGVGGAMQVKSDTQLCVELARQATDWSIATLAVAPVSQLNVFDITGRTPVNLTELAAKRQADKETKQALAALRRLSQVPKPQRPSGAGGRGRGKGAGRSRGRGRAGEDAFARGGASSADTPLGEEAIGRAVKALQGDFTEAAQQRDKVSVQATGAELSAEVRALLQRTGASGHVATQPDAGCVDGSGADEAEESWRSET